MTDKMLILEIHRRAREMQSRRERRAALAWGAASAMLTAALAATILGISLPLHALPRSDLTGASLLADSAGGYVLAAVVAFMAGVAITAACLRRRK